MCQHQPWCQGWPTLDRLAARIVADRRLASPGVLVRPMLYLTKIRTLPAKGVALDVLSTRSPVKTVTLLTGLGVLGYVVKGTFAPLPAAPFNWDALAAGITLAAGIVLPLVYPLLRRGIGNSPLLRVGASALLGTRPLSDR